MTTNNEPGTAPQRDGPGVESTEEPTKQPPGYNEVERDTHDTVETEQIQPSWRPSEDPAGLPENTGMQGEGEPGRSQRDSTGGVEGAGGSSES
jgi:hypothetical protein